MGKGRTVRKAQPPENKAAAEQAALAKQVSEHGSLDKAIEAAKAAVHAHCKPGQCTCS